MDLGLRVRRVGDRDVLLLAGLERRAGRVVEHDLGGRSGEREMVDDQRVVPDVLDLDRLFRDATDPDDAHVEGRRIDRNRRRDARAVERDRDLRFVGIVRIDDDGTVGQRVLARAEPRGELGSPARTDHEARRLTGDESGALGLEEAGAEDLEVGLTVVRDRDRAIDRLVVDDARASEVDVVRPDRDVRARALAVRAAVAERRELVVTAAAEDEKHQGMGELHRITGADRSLRRFTGNVHTFHSCMRSRKACTSSGSNTAT